MCATSPNEVDRLIQSFRRLAVFEYSLPIFTQLHACGVLVGIASQSHNRASAVKLLQLWGLWGCISTADTRMVQVKSRESKSEHLHEVLAGARKLRGSVEWRQMVLFDDLMTNIKLARKLGMVAVHVQDGLQPKHVEQAIVDAEWQLKSRDALSSWLKQNDVYV